MKRMKGLAGVLSVVMILFSHFAIAQQEGIWADFVAELDGVSYALPVEMSVLLENGWEADDAEAVLKPGSYTLSRIKKGKECAYAYMINMGIDDAAAADCLLGGLSLDDYDAEKGATLTVAGVTLGAQKDAVIADWGQPSRDSGSTLSYEQGSYEKVEMSVDSDSGAVTKLDIRNFVTPEGYNDQAYAAPVEIPECVTSYQAPQAMGEDWLSFTFMLNDQLYRLPTPVAVFAENGWELNGSADAPKLAAHESDYGCKLQNGAQALENVGVANLSATANTWDNAMVISFRASGYTPVKIELPNGITLDSKTADLEAALEGKEYTKEESGNFAYYEMKLSYGNSVSVALDIHEGKIVSIEVACDGSEE